MRYYQIGDRQLPSVTTILSATMPGMRRLALTNSNPVATEKARHRGNSVDMLCKAFVSGGREPSLSYQHQGYFRRLRPQLETLRGQGKCLADIQVHSDKHGYAGMLDILCLAHFPIVVEIKTKRQLPTEPNRDDLIQVVAYAHAYAEMNGLLQVDKLLLTASTSQVVERVITQSASNVLFSEFLNRLDIFRSEVNTDGF